jgi:recombination protein RecT
VSKSITPLEDVKNKLSAMKSEFQRALPNHISVDKFIRTIQTAVSMNPYLAQSERTSLFASCMKAAQDGLLPDGKEAAIVTFKDKEGRQIANYMPMVGGILKKVRNSGELSSITSQIVYRNDEFEFYVDEDGEHLKHKPNIFDSGERGEPIGVYALAKTKDGAVYVEVMTAAQIDEVKAVSRGKNGPWSGAFSLEMWKKTVIKRLSKRLPMSTDLEFTMKADDDLYDLDKQDEKQQHQEPPKDVTTKPQRLSKLIDEPVDTEIKDVEETTEVPI